MTDVQTLSHNIIPPESSSRCVVWTWGARAGEQRSVLGGGWTEAVCGRGGGHGHQIPSGGVLAPASLRQRRYGALAARWHHTHTLHKSTQERKRIIPTCHLHQACELTRARGCIPSSLAATRSRCWGRHCCWDACQTRECSVSRWLVHCSVIITGTQRNLVHVAFSLTWQLFLKWIPVEGKGPSWCHKKLTETLPRSHVPWFSPTMLRPHGSCLVFASFQNTEQTMFLQEAVNKSSTCLSYVFLDS